MEYCRKQKRPQKMPARTGRQATKITPSVSSRWLCFAKPEIKYDFFHPVPISRKRRNQPKLAIDWPLMQDIGASEKNHMDQIECVAMLAAFRLKQKSPCRAAGRNSNFFGRSERQTSRCSRPHLRSALSNILRIFA